MNADAILARLRKFLLLISAGGVGMAITELFFLGHWNETIQDLPFALSVLGLVALAYFYFCPNRTTQSTAWVDDPYRNLWLDRLREAHSYQPSFLAGDLPGCECQGTCLGVVGR